MTEEKGMNPRTWSAIALGALLISVALGLILYWQTDSLLSAFAAILLIFGAYMAVSSFFRNGRKDSFGPADADASLAGGVIVAGVGATCLVWDATGEVTITAAVLIIIVAVVGIVMAVKNRNV